MSATAQHHTQALPLPQPSNVTDAAGYAAAQLGNQNRLPWQWQIKTLVDNHYIPTATGKWWYRTAAQLEEMNSNKRRDWTHIGRIMETELGMRNHDNKRCKRCVAEDYKCWQYTSQALRQIRKPASACARCRPWRKLEVVVNTLGESELRSLNCCLLQDLDKSFHRLSRRRLLLVVLVGLLLLEL
jgi:hypothetical protein